MHAETWHCHAADSGNTTSCQGRSWITPLLCSDWRGLSKRKLHTAIRLRSVDCRFDWSCSRAGSCRRHIKVISSKIEKVPNGTVGAKFEESCRNNRSTSKSQHGGRNQVSGRVRVPCWHVTAFANVPWRQLIIRWRSSSVSRSWSWWNVWFVEKSLLAKGPNVI